VKKASEHNVVQCSRHLAISRSSDIALCRGFDWPQGCDSAATSFGASLAKHACRRARLPRARNAVRSKAPARGIERRRGPLAIDYGFSKPLAKMFGV
jgi:hypothetical protein